MDTVRVFLHGELRDLVTARRRDVWFDAPCAKHATIKHAIEALDVPHTEIGRVLVDGAPADLDQPLRAGCAIEVLPAHPIAGPVRFLADAHLGGLARRLRLLGFDCRLASDAADREVARIADEEQRVVLSRDRELLKHRRVARGRFVRATGTDAQTSEVVAAFSLRDRLRPLTRCLECNGLLAAVAAAEVAERVPPGVAASQSEFVRCGGCGRVYWSGTHLRRLRELIDAARR